MNQSNQTENHEEVPANQPLPRTDEEPGTQPPGGREIGGPPGLEPTRYGDWAKAGRCIDF